jgi:uncharacterized membrane protein
MTAVYVLIIISIILLILCIITGIVVSIRSAFISQGQSEEHNALKVGMSVIPVIAFGIGYAISREVVGAFIIDALIMLAICIIALFATGIRSAFISS